MNSGEIFLFIDLVFFFLGGVGRIKETDLLESLLPGVRSEGRVRRARVLEVKSEEEALVFKSGFSEFGLAAHHLLLLGESKEVSGSFLILVRRFCIAVACEGGILVGRAV